MQTVPLPAKRLRSFPSKKRESVLPDPPSIAPEKVRSPSCPDNLPEAAGSCKLCGESPFALGFFHKRKKSVFSQPKDFTVVSQKPSHFLKSTDPPFPAAMRQNKILENGCFSILTLYSKIKINILYLLLIFT